MSDNIDWTTLASCVYFNTLNTYSLSTSDKTIGSFTPTVSGKYFVIARTTCSSNPTSIYLGGTAGLYSYTTGGSGWVSLTDFTVKNMTAGSTYTVTTKTNTSVSSSSNNRCAVAIFRIG